MAIEIHRFGKDHWSTFAYIETCIVDGDGTVDHRRMRSDMTKHPTRRGLYSPDNPSEHPTRLRHYFEDPTDRADSHDDWDCADDLEAAGLLVNNGTGNRPVFALTDLGREVAGQLRGHVGQKKPMAYFDAKLPAHGGA